MASFAGEGFLGKLDASILGNGIQTIYDGVVGSLLKLL